MSTILERRGLIRSNEALTETLWLMKIEVEDIGAQLQPGQFIHVQIPGMEGHILRRPFSVYFTDEDRRVLVILYQVVGFGSAHMTTLTPGAIMDVMGPIGHGWTIPNGSQRALLVAGGVGGAPLYLFAEALVQAGVEVDFILGAQT